MYKVLVDSNILIDFMFHREPFYNNSNKIISLCENKKIKGYLTTSILMDLHYIFKKNSHSKSTADTAIADIMNVFEVINVEDKDIKNSIKNERKDFKDGVIESCAIRNKLNYIVTRNETDFENKGIKVVSPEKALTIFTR